MSTKLTEAEIRAATEAHIRAALAAVQRAQNELATACQHLSPLEWGNPTYRKANALYDRVHSFWYVVERLLSNKRVRIDRTNIEALERLASRNSGG